MRGRVGADREVEPTRRHVADHLLTQPRELVSPVLVHVQVVADQGGEVVRRMNCTELCRA